MRNKQLVGIVVGLALALGGPGGLAVGFFSHPVGVLSHPSAHGDVYASEYAYGQASHVEEGLRATGWAYAFKSDGMHARGSTQRGDYERLDDIWFYADLRICNPGCRTHQVVGRNADFRLGPVLGSATLSGRSRGKDFEVTFEQGGPISTQRYSWGTQRIPEILLAGYDGAGMYRPMQLTSITIGENSINFDNPGWGQGARNMATYHCLSASTTAWC
jgi:hypothetical protein